MIKDKPLISCIVPVYNAEKYLYRCVDSILAQDYKALEIILIDDGSTDKSSIICDKYSSLHSNIRVKHIFNSGASLARKVGLELAAGEYITFVDADDYVVVNYISAMFSALQEYDVFVAGCRFKSTEIDYEVKNTFEFSKEFLCDESLMYRFFNYEFWALWGSLYHKSVFSKVYFPKATISEDYYIKCQIFLNDCRMAYVDAPLYIYEKHEGSLSNTKLSSRAFEEFENVYKVYKLILSEKHKYAMLSLKNVIETCVKLLLMGTSSERRLYRKQYEPIKTFLKNHTLDILKSKYLLSKTKIIAIIIRFLH